MERPKIVSVKALLEKILPAQRIKTDYIDRVSFASDAGFYYLVPLAVVQPVSEAEIIALFAFSRQYKVPLVFRTGGTSLSGQSVTDGILVDLSQHWNKVIIGHNGNEVAVQPGITGAMVNTFLKKYHRKIGPDPSSISAAMMGGILSNNASGMCCGVQYNSYHTVKHVRFILPSGNCFSTENEADYQRFKTECPALFDGITNLRNEVLNNPILLNKIRHKYLTKTTVGYSLNALVDYSHPLDILAHLLIGAEGTLAFIAQAVLQTIPDYPCKSTALLYFSSVYDACKAIVPLTNAGAMMVELMDRASLHAVENLDGMPAVVKQLPESAAALLIEFQEATPALLEQRVNDFLQSATQMALLNAPVFTMDAGEQDFLWKVRKGLFPAVGAVRASGTTVILEDVAFPVEKLGDAIAELQQLFKKYGYYNAIIFGHAKDGNIHFVVTQSFNTTEEVQRYDAFIQEVVTLVVQRYNGTLKAEHGTGRNMAPFVQTEWGAEAYNIMQQIKWLIDPHGLLNPGVIINDDARAHIKNLKTLPPVEEEVDRCIECGYCEHKCPSRDITATPRRRIVVRRVLKNLQLAGDKKNYQLLLQQYQYQGLDTCAVDGLCATACPVDINTGDLVKRLRSENHSPYANRLAYWTARHFKTIEWCTRFALASGAALNALLGRQTMARLTGALKKIVPSFPLWTNQLQAPPRLKTLLTKSNATNIGSGIVYFPTCISRTMGSYPGKAKNVMDTFLSICLKAGVPVQVPADIKGSCCGQVFSSKGFAEAYRFTAHKVVAQLWYCSNEGALPVVTDVSSCAYTLQQLRAVLDDQHKQWFDQLKIMDSIVFLHDAVLPLVPPVVNTKNIILHPVCSLQKMKTVDRFIKIARHFAHTVTVPDNAGCCGMAGDRGFLYPELTSAATQYEAAEVSRQLYDGYYASTKTCEMALSEAVKQNYQSILYLVDESMQ
jgi:D-lactate dehydrogenase